MAYAIKYLRTYNASRKLSTARRWLYNYSAGYQIQGALNTAYPQLFNESNTLEQMRVEVTKVYVDVFGATLANSLQSVREQLEFMCEMWYHLVDLQPPKYLFFTSTTAVNFGSVGNPIFIEV